MNYDLFGNLQVATQTDEDGEIEIILHGETAFLDLDQADHLIVLLTEIVERGEP